jgi:hypothetical protein
MRAAKPSTTPRFFSGAADFSAPWIHSIKVTALMQS